MTWVMTSKKQFYLHDDESLLDGLLRTGHDINYQCKEGLLWQLPHQAHRQLTRY